MRQGNSFKKRSGLAAVYKIIQFRGEEYEDKRDFRVNSNDESV